MFSSRGRSKERTSPTKASPPSPSYMSNDQFGMSRCLHTLPPSGTTIC